MCKATRSHQPEELVLKVLTSNDQKIEDSPVKELAMLCAEVSVLAEIQKHPNIVGFYGVCLMESPSYSSPKWAIQMEYCRGGDLVNAISRSRMTEDEAYDLMLDVLEGLAHMHGHGFVHRDVKPDNVLIANDGTAKLADFGISAKLSDPTAMAKRCGSPGYIAPEVWEHKEYGIKIDSFSAGALLHFVICGRSPFCGKSVKSVMVKTLNNSVNFRKSVCLERLSDGCKAFMLTLLEKESASRPTATEALQVMWTSTPAEEPMALSSSWKSEGCSKAVDEEEEFLSDMATTYRSSGREASRYQSTGSYTSERNSNPEFGGGDNAADDVALLGEYKPSIPKVSAPSMRSPLGRKFLAAKVRLPPVAD
jgi:serine/threonine protein kinase